MDNSFFQFIQEPLAQRSLVACIMIGFANGFASGLVVLRKSALQIGTLSCALLPGIAVAILIFGLLRWYPAYTINASIKAQLTKYNHIININFIYVTIC